MCSRLGNGAQKLLSGTNDYGSTHPETNSSSLLPMFDDYLKLLMDVHSEASNQTNGGSEKYYCLIYDLFFLEFVFGKANAVN